MTALPTTRLRADCADGGRCRCAALDAIRKADRDARQGDEDGPSDALDLVVDSDPSTASMEPWQAVPPVLLARTARHESAHAVTAAILGIRVQTVTVALNTRGAAITALQPIGESIESKSPAEIVAEVVARIAVTQAGIAVDEASGVASWHACRVDLAHVNDWATRITPRCVVDALTARTMALTRELIHDAGQPISRVAEALINRPHVLTGEQVERIVGSDLAGLRWLYSEVPGRIAADLPDEGHLEGDEGA